MSITLDDIKVALAIVENGEGSEITLRADDIELIIRRGPSGMAATPPAPLPAIAHPPTALAAAPETAGPTSTQSSAAASAKSAPSPTAIALLAPLTGVIYRAPAPGEPPFVTPGASVGEDTVVCIIDVMKVMNLIKAPAAGRIAQVGVQDGQLVSKGDVILWVEPN